MMGEEFAWPAVLRESRGCVCFQMKRGMRAMIRAYDDALRPSGLRSTQFSMLGVVKAFGPLSSAKLGKLMVIDKTTLPRSLALLAREGLIKVRQGDDRREKLLSLTGAGESRFKRAYPLWKAAQDRVKKRLGRSRIKSLIRGMSEAAQAAKAGIGHD
jgi:DNA-binding MarR family transcriptional regulator